MADSVVRRDTLKKVQFGKSTMLVTEACIGTMTWGSFNGEEEEAFAQLDRAVLHHGANFIDTAELYPVAFNYGKTTEKWIGNWLVKRAAEGKLQRSDLYIATKSNPSRIGGFPDGEERPDDYCHSYEPELLEGSCRQSIERMQCEYIDLYQLHWPSRDTPVFGCAHFYPKNKARGPPFADEIPAGEPGYDVFERQVLSVKRLLDLGLIKHWGLSNENAFGISMFCITCDRLGVPRPVSCQNDFSMLNRTYESDTWEAAYRFGVVGLPYGCLAGGVLTGKYHEGKWSQIADADRSLTLSRQRAQPEFQPRYGAPTAMVATEEYIRLAEEYDLTPTELALAWAKQRDCNASIITGTTSVQQVDECLAAFKLDLPDELMDKVDELHEQFRHPSCWYSPASKEAFSKGKWMGEAARCASGPVNP